MNDLRRRSWEQQLQADPDDQDALHAAIAARQRAGLPVPAWMLDRVLSPPRRFDAPLVLDVSVLLPSGRVRGVGRTPSADPDGLELPEHRSFWVKPAPPTDALLASLCDVLRAESVPGVALGADLSDAGLARLAEVGHLTRLDLSACTRLTAAGFGSLTPLESLSHLRLWYCTGLDTAGLAHVSRLRGLSALDLTNCTRFQGAGLAGLEAMPELATLRLGGCAQVGDAALGHLARLPRLTSLDLRRCTRITDAGLAHLARLPELTVLNLSGCPEISDDGLFALRDLPRLSQLYLVGCGLREEQVASALGKIADRCQWVL